MESERYYKSELNKVSFKTDFAPTIKIRDSEEGTTKWLDLNEVSARAIIEKLKEVFNIKD